MLKSEKQLKNLFYIMLAGIAIDVYMSIVMAQQVSSIYYYGLLAVPVLIVLAVYFYKKMKFVRYITYIRRQWAKKEDRKRNFKNISKLFKTLSSEDKNKFYLDNQTWQDLNMNDVFACIDRTLTCPGEEMLYNILRTPEFHEETINNRVEIMKLLEKDKELREKIQISLYKLGRQRENDLVEFLYEEMPKQSSVRYLVYLLSLAAVASVVSFAFLDVKSAGMFVVFMYFINFIVHSKVKKNICEEVSAIGKLGPLIGGAKALTDIKNIELKKHIDILKNASKDCGTIAKKTSTLGRTEGIDVLGDYVNIFFLAEASGFFLALSDIRKYRDELKAIYLTLGELDALVSMASYKAGLESYTKPKFTKDGSGISIKNMKHPLIEKAVPNSIEIKKGGIIITGSNMSGKSTFLRTFGVNGVFAQTIGICLAEEYSGSFLKVITSISPEDNIMGGKSYYLGEAEALLRIIKSCEDKVPSLCIIDEIFRGTNPTERISAAAEILDYLPNHNALVVVATHDIELTELVENEYKCYYFNENVEEEGLTFDYKIKKGVSNTRNAIKLLKFLGYPNEIVDKANKRIETIQ